jgi:hypothetical protein
MLKAKIMLKTSCIANQTALTRFCYPNDPSHKQVITDAQNGIKRCQEILAKKVQNCQC